MLNFIYAYLASLKQNAIGAMPEEISDKRISLYSCFAKSHAIFCENLLKLSHK